MWTRDSNPSALLRSCSRHTNGPDSEPPRYEDEARSQPRLLHAVAVVVPQWPYDNQMKCPPPPHTKTCMCIQMAFPAASERTPAASCAGPREVAHVCRPRPLPVPLTSQIRFSLDACLLYHILHCHGMPCYSLSCPVQKPRNA